MLVTLRGERVNEDLDNIRLRLRRQSICSSVHVKDWLSFPLNLM